MVVGGAFECADWTRDDAGEFCVLLGDTEALQKFDQMMPLFVAIGHSINSPWRRRDTSRLHLGDWPSQSPDLNIIEHLWDHLKRKIRARDPQPETVEQLWEVTLQEWQSIDKEFIRRLYRSLPKRVAEVKKAKGGNTSY